MQVRPESRQSAASPARFGAEAMPQRMRPTRRLLLCLLACVLLPITSARAQSQAQPPVGSQGVSSGGAGTSLGPREPARAQETIELDSLGNVARRARLLPVYFPPEPPILGDPLPSGFNQTIDQWFDPTAFAPTTAFTYGNCGINTVRGPSFKSTNFSLFRSIPIGAARRIELRWEVFNLFNDVNYGLPGSNVDSPTTLGVITSTNGSPREMQLAVKFYF